jgi:hypothetical protein
VATLNRGQFFQTILTGPSQITATQPILVAQYSNGSSFDNVTSDPFMMLTPPFEQFLAGYTVTTPATGFANNFINIVAPTAGVGNVKLDGTAIPASAFVPIGSSGFSGTQQRVGLGSHTLTGDVPFGTFVYGFDSFDSYGYPGGMSLAPVATVTSVALTPKTASNVVGTQHCVTATVLDQNGHALAGIRVDFAITGMNPTTGFAFTETNGASQFCWTGTVTGQDTVKATVGTLSDTATKTWTPKVVADNVAPSCALKLVGTDSTGHTFIQIAVQDSGSGLKSIVVTEHNNANVAVPSFTPATTELLIVTATKINQAKSSQVALQVTDQAGNITNCDPILTEVGRDGPGGAPVSETFHHVARGESRLQITNGTPGVSRLKVTVNGRDFEVRGLDDGEVRSLDVGSAMRRGNNTITITAEGKDRGAATVMISDK